MASFAHDQECTASSQGEDRRLATLRSLDLLDTPPEREFDTLAAMAKRLIGCKAALISLIDDKRQWVKARCGMDVSEAPLEHSICSRAVDLQALVVVSDAAADPLYATNPYVTGTPFIRFYAGIPLRAKERHGSKELIPVGTLCVIDSTPRTLSDDDLKTLQDLASLTEALIDARSSAHAAIVLAQERQAYAMRLDREQRQFRQAERLANIGSWRLSLADRKTDWSNQVFAIHELPVDDRPPLETALDFYPPQSREMIKTALARAIETGQPFDLETDFITAKGNARRVRSMGELELYDGKPVAVIGVFQDITVRHHLEQSLRRSASTDDLTQIANRARFNHVLDEKIVAARAANTSLALVLIDLDGFKQINDLCGHRAGDALLQLTSAKLQAAYLSRCFVARLGGDEFVVIASTPDECAGLDLIIQRLLGDLRQSVSYSDGLAQVSGTIGISWLDETVRNRSELLHRADIALYAAKKERRGSAKVFEDQLAPEFSRTRMSGALAAFSPPAPKTVARSG